MKYLILLLLTVACSKQSGSDPRDIQGVNTQFTTYVQAFEALYGNDIGDIPIQFGDISINEAGQCIDFGDGHKEIKINQGNWNSYGDEAKYSLIMHELGHCVLNRGHDTTIMSNGYPESYMYPGMFFSHSIVSLKSHYDAELFGR